MTYLSATIEKHGRIFIGWLDDIKGITAQGSSIKEVKSDLIYLYQIKKEVEKKQREIQPCTYKNIFHEEIPLHFAV